MKSIDNLKEYCRTCLLKLERTNGYESSKPIHIKQFPDIEHLIKICLADSTADDGIFCCYTPYLCRSCFEKWSEFSKLYQVAIKTDERIKKMLQSWPHKTENTDDCELNENLNEFFINTKTLEDTNEIEKYETDSPFYTRDHVDSAVGAESNVDDCSSSYSENAEVMDFISESKKHRLFQVKKAQKKESSRKSFRILKQAYKTRKSLLVDPEIRMFQNLNENVSDIGSEEKKIRYHCEQCNKYFWKKNKYDGHMKQVHEGIKRPYKCQECDKAYNLYKTLLQHKREYHSEKSQKIYQCEKCNKTFKTNVILKQHLIYKHTEQKESMRSICDQCGFIAAHQYSLSRHIINKHTQVEQIKCDQCPKVFKTQYSLKYHVIGNHNPSKVKPFKCPECEMGFTRKTLLNQHKRTHLKYNERIKCDFEGCEVRFVKHGDKTHHMRLVHLKVKQHICDYCGEAFGAMQTLRHHRFIHTGEKPYKCNVCGQGFRQRTAMKTHRKTHFVKKPENQDFINDLPEINLSLVNNLDS